MQEKDTHNIRAAFKAKRAELTPETQREAAERAVAIWLSQPALRQVKRAGLHWAVRGELPTQLLINQLTRLNTAIYLPKPDDHNTGHLLFGRYLPDAPLSTDRFGIKIPNFDRSEAIELEALDVIVMPLVATDEQGNRVGMGAGYYDRTLSRFKASDKLESSPLKPEPGTSKGPLLVGWCYEWQVTDSPLRAEAWDVPLSGLITDHRIRWFL